MNIMHHKILIMGLPCEGKTTLSDMIGRLLFRPTFKISLLD